MAEPQAEAGTCALCGGRGWVVESDGGAGAARPCECRGRVALERLLNAARIPPRYQGCTLARFQVAGIAAHGARGERRNRPAEERLLTARRLCERYVDSFLQLPGEDRPQGGFRETGLLFMGPSGVGKTHLAVAVLLELIRRYRVRGLFVDFTSLIHQIQSTFDPASPESRRDVLDPVMEAEVLVLDELGAQKPTPFVNDILYLVLNHRYTRRLATLFTTNHYLARRDRRQAATGAEAAEEERLLERRIPALLVSRLYEMAQEVEIEAPDFRKEVKRQQILRSA